jgi:plastocyanin
MGRKQLTLLICGTLVLVTGVLGVAFSTRGNGSSTAGCIQVGSAHTVVIKDSQLNSPAITAKRCDSLTIKNLDSTIREVGFGPHDHHQPYDGIAEKVLRQDQSLTVTLVQTGTFDYHDHFHDEVAGTFTVLP